MSIPKPYFALIIVLIVGAGAVGYTFFINPFGSSPRSPDSLNNQSLAVNDSVAPRLKNSSEAKTPPVKLTVNNPQAKGLKQHSSDLKIAATVGNREAIDSPHGNSSTASAIKHSRKADPVNAAPTERDYSKVLDQLNETKDSAERQQLITDLINSLAHEDPRVALAIVNQIQGLPEQYQFSSNFMNTLLKKNPQEAMMWVESIQDNDWVQKNLYYVLGKELVSTDPQSLKPWIDTIKDAALRGNVIDGIAFEWALSDPQAAYQWMIDNVSETEGEQAMIKIAQGMSKQDAPRAAHWTSQFPEGPNKVEAMRSVAINWAAKDSVAAVRWLKELPQSESRDKALSALGSQ